MSADICVFFVALKVFPSPKQYTVEVLQKWILDYSFSDKESKQLSSQTFPQTILLMPLSRTSAFHDSESSVFNSLRLSKSGWKRTAL